MDIRKILETEIEFFAQHDLKGKNIVLTGEMECTRRQMTLMLESVGANVKSSVTKTTDIVVFDHLWAYKPASSKEQAARKLEIPIITSKNIINNIRTLKLEIQECVEKVFSSSSTPLSGSRVRWVSGKRFNIIDDTDEADATAWCKEYPFLINRFSWELNQTIVLKNLSLFKFIDHKRYAHTNGLVIKVVSRDGSIFEDIAADKKKNLQIIEAAMFADSNPKIQLCKKLLALQIQYLDLDFYKASSQDREYVWEVYCKKKNHKDVLLIAKEKERFFRGLDSK